MKYCKIVLPKKKKDSDMKLYNSFNKIFNFNIIKKNYNR